MGHLDEKKFQWRVVSGYKGEGGVQYLPEDDPLFSSNEVKLL